jgi:hypothetical protein
MPWAAPHLCGQAVARGQAHARRLQHLEGVNPPFGVAGDRGRGSRRGSGRCTCENRGGQGGMSRQPRGGAAKQTKKERRSRRQRLQDGPEMCSKLQASYLLQQPLPRRRHCLCPSLATCRLEERSRDRDGGRGW